MRRKRKRRPLGPRPALLAAIFATRGGVPDLARHVNLTRQAVYQWRRVPKDYLHIVARWSGVPAQTLRPDLFDAMGNEIIVDKHARPPSQQPTRQELLKKVATLERKLARVT